MAYLYMHFMCQGIKNNCSGEMYRVRAININLFNMIYDSMFAYLINTFIRYT